LATDAYSFAYHSQAGENGKTIYISENVLGDKPDNWRTRDIAQHVTLVNTVLWSTFAMFHKAAPFLFVRDSELDEIFSQQQVPESLHPKVWSEVRFWAEDLTHEFALLVATWLLRCPLPLNWLIQSISTPRGMVYPIGRSK
jgi:hypothetical protein